MAIKHLKDWITSRMPSTSAFGNVCQGFESEILSAYADRLNIPYVVFCPQSQSIPAISPTKNFGNWPAFFAENAWAPESAPFRESD